MQSNLRLRAKVNASIRRSFDAQDFCEVETPLLWAPTPEGAREFVVPSRLQAGEFYVLPQSPQIAKQLLMVGGFDRYYQIARCMRDEDLRADRQFEFTQFDLEASFVTRDDVLGFMTEAMAEVTEAVRGERPGAFDTITWFDALDRYGTDKPDLRFGMELVELTPVFAATAVRAFSAACVPDNDASQSIAIKRRAVTPAAASEISHSKGGTMISGCSIFAGSLPACGLRSVWVEPGQITATRMLWPRSSSAIE